VSRLIGHDSSIEELVANPRGIATKMKLQLDAEKRMQLECPFTPDLSQTKDKFIMGGGKTSNNSNSRNLDKNNKGRSGNNDDDESNVSPLHACRQPVKVGSPTNTDTVEKEEEEEEEEEEGYRPRGGGGGGSSSRRSRASSLNRPSFKTDLEERFEMEERRKKEVEVSLITLSFSLSLQIFDSYKFIKFNIFRVCLLHFFVCYMCVLVYSQSPPVNNCCCCCCCCFFKYVYVHCICTSTTKRNGGPLKDQRNS
jgi:hypothetical protein